VGSTEPKWGKGGDPINSKESKSKKEAIIFKNNAFPEYSLGENAKPRVMKGEKGNNVCVIKGKTMGVFETSMPRKSLGRSRGKRPSTGGLIHPGRRNRR